MRYTEVENVNNATVIKAFKRIKENQVMFAKVRGELDKGIVIYELEHGKKALEYMRTEEPAFYLWDRIKMWQDKGFEVIFV